jgi:hypothetical protein
MVMSTSPTLPTHGARFRRQSKPEERHDMFYNAFPPLESAAMRVTNDIPLGCSLLLPVGTVNPVQTLKANMWRTTPDISNTFTSMIKSAVLNNNANMIVTGQRTVVVFGCRGGVLVICMSLGGSFSYWCRHAWN